MAKKNIEDKLCHCFEVKRRAESRLCQVHGDDLIRLEQMSLDDISVTTETNERVDEGWRSVDPEGPIRLFVCVHQQLAV